MKVGDLISFKPDGYDNDEWSEPAVIVKKFDYVPPIWKVWVWSESEQFVINEDDYQIMLLTSSLQKET